VKGRGGEVRKEAERKGGGSLGGWCGAFLHVCVFRFEVAQTYPLRLAPMSREGESPMSSRGGKKNT